MSRTNAIVLGLLILWCCDSLSASALMSIQEQLQALGIALLIQPWIVRQFG